MQENNLYKQLNESVLLDKAFEDYKQYRTAVTHEIIDLIKDNKLSKLAVFGAGNMMDIDYSQLMELRELESICITDIDGDALIKGSEFYNIQDTRFKCITMDYLNQRESELRALDQTLRYSTYTEPEAISHMNLFFQEQVHQIGKLDYYENLNLNPDYIVVCPIYTQLMYLELEVKLKGNPWYQAIKETMLQNMIYIIDAFNQRLIKLLQPGGSLFVLSDIIELNEMEINTFYSKQDVMKNGLTDDEKVRIAVKEEIQSYENKYGMGLGSFGLFNMKEYLRPGKETYFHWRFNEKKHFFVKGIQYHSE